MLFGGQPELCPATSSMLKEPWQEEVSLGAISMYYIPTSLRPIKQCPGSPGATLSWRPRQGRTEYLFCTHHALHPLRLAERCTKKKASVIVIAKCTSKQKKNDCPANQHDTVKPQP